MHKKIKHLKVFAVILTFLLKEKHKKMVENLKY